MPAEDEEALRWVGDAEPQVSAKRVPHQHEVESTSEADAVLDFDEDDEESVVSSSSLVLMGVLGGVFFLYSLGWMTYALRSVARSGDVLAAFMFNSGLWLAVAAPALWFGASFALVKHRSLRYGLLVLGALVLIPIPLVWPS